MFRFEILKTNRNGLYLSLFFYCWPVFFSVFYLSEEKRFDLGFPYLYVLFLFLRLKSMLKARITI